MAEKLNNNERKEMLRQQRQKSHEEYEKQEKNKKILLWAGIGVALAVGVGVLVWAVFQENTGSNNAEVVSPEADGKSYGNLSSNVEFVEYGDFRCGYCKQFYTEVFKSVKEEYKNDVHFAYRHYPVTGGNAEIVAYASEAAAKQGKFWEMHDILFEEQGSWSGLGATETRDRMIAYATTLGLDIAQFEADIDSPEVKDIVQDDYDSGKKVKIQGTPSFFLNGEPVVLSSGGRFDAELLRGLLDAAIANQATSDDDEDSGQEDDNDDQEDDNNPDVDANQDPGSENDDSNNES